MVSNLVSVISSVISNKTILHLLLTLQLSTLPSLVNPLMALSEEELTIANTEEQLNDVNSELPCLDSRSECVEQLTTRAVAGGALSASAHSPKLKKLEERITLIDERLELMGGLAQRVPSAAQGLRRIPLVD